VLNGKASDAVERVLSSEPGWRHLYHPAMLPQVPRVAMRVVEGMDDPPDASLVEEFLYTEIARCRRVAGDPVILLRWFGDSEFILQHRLTGMRIKVKRRGDLLWYIVSRSQDISSLGESKLLYSTCYGLGIGYRLYLQAAALLPRSRFVDTSTSDEGRGVRRKLHMSDPYVWNDRSCEWCRERNILDHAEFARSTEGRFKEHPVAEPWPRLLPLPGQSIGSSQNGFSDVIDLSDV